MSPEQDSPLQYGQQGISKEDIAAVVETLQSDYLTSGPKTVAFEERFAERIGAKHAIATSSATAALHLAMVVAGIQKGDRVITSPNTFLASANCAAMVGATPDFADIETISYTLCPSALEQSWRADTKAIVPVDYAGQTADLPRLAAIARKHGATIIEDASHATGGAVQYAGEIHQVGGHMWADMTVFSFHPVKTMTTGEGGMLVTNDPHLAAKARRLRSHGVTREVDRFVGLGADHLAAFAEQGPWYYEMNELGWNYRITDIQCALGLSQLAQLNTFIERRREIVRQYNQAFGDLNWIKTPGLRNPADRDLTAWHLYTLHIDFESLAMTRTEVMSRLRKAGVNTQVLYIPVHLQPFYRERYGYGLGKCPIAESHYTRSLSLPLYPRMTEPDIARVIAAIRSLQRP